MAKTAICNDSQAISGLYGESETWQITLDNVDKIEAYLEDGDIPWFAIYINNRIAQRVNSRYVESVVYL